MPLALLLLANALNLALDLVLMFGWDAVGVPAFGVVGAAYASVAGRLVAAGLAFAWLARRRHVLSLRAVPPPAVALPVARPLLADAWPLSLQIGLRAALVVALTVVVQRRFGDAATAALGIATRLDTLILFASLGFANAATVYAGRAVVVARPGLARAAGLWAAFAAGLFGLGMLLGMQGLAAAIVGWFLPGAPGEVLAVMRLYLDTVGWSQVLGAVAFGAIGAVHGAGRMVAPLVVDLLGFGVVFAWFGLVVFGAGDLAAVFASLVGGMGCVAVLHLGFVGIGRWPLLR